MRLEASTPADLPQIKVWWDADEDHKRKPFSDDFFLTGSGLLVFRLDDSHGAVLYTRIEQDSDPARIRMHIQFAPSDRVSRRRVVSAILKTLPVVIEHFNGEGFQQMVFDSVSPSLIKFLSHFGFEQTEGTNDYMLTFAQVELVN